MNCFGNNRNLEIAVLQMLFLWQYIVVKKLSVLLIRSYVGPFAITFLVAMFIFEMQFIWVYLDDLMGKGLEPWVIVKLLFFASARVVNMALPLAILMSSIMTMGAMAENFELAAMKSAGVSLLKIMRPLFFVSVLIAFGAFVFANNLWPVANLKCRTLLFSIIKQRPSLNLSSGVFYNGIEGVSIRAAEVENESGDLEDVLIYDYQAGDRANRSVLRAERGKMSQTDDKRFMVLELEKGVSYNEQREEQISKPGARPAQRDKDYPLITGSFEKMTLRFDLSSLAFKADDDESMKNPAEMMNVGQLKQYIDSTQWQLDTLYDSYAVTASRLFRSRLAGAEALPESGYRRIELNESSSGFARKSLQHAIESSRKQSEQHDRQIQFLESKKKGLNRFQMEWHRKFFLAVVCVVLFFIGAPLGAIIRKGGLGMPTMYALGLFIFYQLLTMMGERMARNQIIDAWLGMWMSTLILFPLAIFITVRASREARLQASFSPVEWISSLRKFLFR